MAEATSSMLVIRSTPGVPMHSATASNGVGGRGMCAVGPDPVQRDTSIRRDARVWAQPKWIFIALVAQQAEQPPCKRQAARSKRRRGHQTSMSCSSRPAEDTGLSIRERGFESRTRHQADKESLVELTLRGMEIGRDDRAAPEPVTGWIFIGGVAQAPVEQPPCKRQRAGSNPVTSTTLR